MLKRVGEVRIVVPVRDKVCYVLVPARLRLDEVIHGQLEVIVRCVDTSNHDLVTQHEAPHKLRTIQFQWPVTRWDAGHYVHTVDGYCINEVELETGDPSSLEDQVEQLNLADEVVWRNLTS